MNSGYTAIEISVKSPRRFQQLKTHCNFSLPHRRDKSNNYLYLCLSQNWLVTFLTVTPGGFELDASPTDAGLLELGPKPTNNGTDSYTFGAISNQVVN
jgi:hypothetical protein